ncbi:MAG: hypothetical protein HYZ22_05885 [Chloroflexi bacterium]|nr:hypothetical protein [Chloroflexota bacterium]
MDANSWLVTCAVYDLGFAVFHLLFWKIFRWKEDLASLNHVNRAVMQILNLRLTYVFVVMAFVLAAFQVEMSTTRLGQGLLIAFSVFWFMRAIEQVIFFGFKNRISNALLVVFLLGGVFHLLPVIL